MKIRKALITEFGDASKVVVVDGEISAPLPNQVQVQVEFAGFSGADINMRRGTYPFQKKAPLTPGYCLVGKVQMNGAGSNKFEIGDRVGCLSVDGGEAELVNLPEQFLVRVPDGVDSQQVTCLILDWNMDGSGLAKERLFTGLVVPKKPLSLV